jgi:hypothetical protein
VPHGSSAFPFAVYDVDYATGNQPILPLHWHEEIYLCPFGSGRILRQPCGDSRAGRRLPDRQFRRAA